ncbi:MAG TPA: sigma-70 family RNA polymerase sigma factor [Burkholderiales bacterium]|nr:sigma-70 family RNA polymerase sigma factor [Burkholderiales bacterium]
MTGPTNQELAAMLARCALSDQRAFDALYQASSAKLFGVAVRITRRKDWAEEVLQESFVKIWHHAGNYDTAKSAPMTWMTAIVRNRALDWLRRPREVQTSEEVEAFLASVPDEGPGPEELAVLSARSGRLHECLEQLGADQKRSITLAFFHGLSHGELAQKMDKPLGTVKTWVRRGLDRLRHCLDGLDLK